MATTTPTAKQRRLKTEIDDIAAAVTMDHWNIADYDEDARTAILGVMKVKLVRAEIIMKYTLIDEKAYARASGTCKSCVQNRNTAVGSPSISRGAG